MAVLCSYQPGCRHLRQRRRWEPRLHDAAQVLRSVYVDRCGRLSFDGRGGCSGGNTIANGCTGATTAAGALANLGGLPLAGGTLTGPLVLAADPTTALQASSREYVDAFGATAIQAYSQQANLAPSVVYDHFLYADGTALATQTAESANSQWTVTGGSAPTVIDQHLTATGSVSTPFYASLPNTSAVGGTPSPITTLGATFRFQQPNLTGNVYDPSMVGVTLIAQNDTTLTKLLHLEIAPTRWMLVDSITGPSGFYTVATGNLNLAADASSEYSAQMIINYTNNTVQVKINNQIANCYDANGNPLVGCVASDPNITTIDPLYMTIESAIFSAGATPQAAQGEWGSVWMGGPSQAQKRVAAGGSAMGADVNTLQGTAADRRWQYPDGTGPMFVIPNTAGGGGPGCYRIATAGVNNLYLLYSKDFTITASVAGYYTQAFSFTASSGAGAAAIPSLSQISGFGSPLIIDNVVLSTDSGGANIGLDVCTTSINTTDAVRMIVTGTGIFTPETRFTVGATPYSIQTSFVPSGAIANYAQTLTGGVGWYSLITETGNCGGYCLKGTFTVQVTSPLLGTQDSVLTADCNTSGCTVGQIWSTNPGLITQIRGSWDSVGGHVHFDAYDAFSATYPLTLTGNLFGQYTVNPSPTVGATALGSGSMTYSLMSGGGGGAAFSAITSGTNTNALVIGSGGSMDYGGSGTINANKLSGVPFCTGFTPTSGQQLQYTTARFAESLLYGSHRERRRYSHIVLRRQPLTAVYHKRSHGGQHSGADLHALERGAKQRACRSGIGRSRSTQLPDGPNDQRGQHDQLPDAQSEHHGQRSEMDDGTQPRRQQR